MQPMVNLALRAVRNAGLDLASRLERFDFHQSSDQEKAKFIADCTIGLEKNMIFDLKKSLPEHNFLGRETGFNGADEKQPTWQIAVIDDLTNFKVGIPNFAISVACLINGKTEHVVISNPLNNDEFTASRGRGAQLNGRRIRSSGLTNLQDAIIGYTQPAGSSESVVLQRQRIIKMISQGLELRNIGSNALTLCYVAANRFQAALISQIDEFSLVAAQLIATEAGCLLSTVEGGIQIKAPSDIIASGPRLLKGMVALSN